MSESEIEIRDLRPSISPQALRTLLTAPAGAVRPNSFALHFFPLTRPPDIETRLEFQGPLVNTYSSLDLRSIQRHRPKCALALTRSGGGVDLHGDSY